MSKKPKIRLPKIPDRKIARIYEYIDAKEWAKARECIERYYKDFSFDATAYYAYEEILFESGAATPELIRIVREAAAGHPDEAGLLFNSGLAYLRGGYPALAHRALSSYCSRRLKEPESQEAERMVEELEEMLPGVLKNSGFRWPEDKETFYRLEEGRALMENFPDEDAVSIFEEALKIKPDSPMVLNNLARCLWERGEIDRAYETAKSAAEAFPSNLYSLCALIRYGITGGFKINVSDMRRKILALDPPPEHDYFPLFIESLVFLGEFGGIPEIVAKYKPLPNSIPPFKKAFIWHYAAAAALKQGDSRTARRYWGYAVRADDGFERAARILDEWDESSYREEHPGFFEITEILPRCVIRGINAAYREKSKFRSGDSVQSLYRRFPYVSKFILPLLTFGDRHARDFAIMLDAFLSRSGEGRSHLQKISFQPTEKLPSAIAPHFEKGYALLMEKDKEAESVFREAIALDPNIPNLWQNLAAALEQQGKKEESEAVINKIFEKFPDYSFGRINMAVRAALKGDVPGARKFLEPLMEKDVLHVSEYTGVCQASFFICRAEDDDTGMKAWLDCWKKAAPDDVRIEEFELEIRLKNMLNSPDSFFSVEKRNGEKENQKY